MGWSAYHSSPKLLLKVGFSDEQKGNDSGYPFFTLKHSIEQLQSRDETFVPDNVTCDDVLTFDNEVAVIQEILTDKMMAAEMWVDESDMKRKKKRKQEADMSLMEKPNAS